MSWGGSTPPRALCLAGNGSEDESEEEEEITEVEPGKPKPTGEGLERGRNDDPKIIGTPHDKRVLQANSPIQNSHRVRKRKRSRPETTRGQ